MTDSILKISARGAFSEAWNKCIDSNVSCGARFRISIKAFIKALIFGYKISKENVAVSFLQDGCHAGSIFGKEYGKLQKRNLAKAPDIEQTYTNGKSNDLHKQELFLDKGNYLENGKKIDKNTDLEKGKNTGENTNLEKEKEKETDEMIEVKNDISDLKKLMLEIDFDINHECFKVERLVLLSSEDYLQLLDEAYALDKAELALRLIFARDCRLSEEKQKDFLFFFACHGMASAVTLLLNKCNENLVNCKDKNGSTLMTVVAKAGLVTCLKLLLDKGANVNETDNLDRTPLQCAARGGNVESLKFLLENGAMSSINHACKNTGMTALCYAAEIGDLACIEALLQGKGVSLKGVGGTAGPLSIVAYKGDTYLGCFNALLKFDPSACNDRDVRGHTALAYAMSSESKMIFETLLEVDDIDINATDCLGRSFLVLAIEYEQKEYCAAILAHKNFDIKHVRMTEVEGDDEGDGVLHLAAKLIDTTYLRMLLDHGDLDVNIQNKKGETPLQHAMTFNAFQCVEMLLKERNIDFSLTDDMGNTLLHCFVKMHIPQFLDALLAVEDGIQSYANNQNVNGDTALHLAVLNCDTFSVKKLLTIKGIIISIKRGSEGLTPLELAETRPRMAECAKLLREHKRKMARSKDGFTASAVRIE